MKNRAPRPIFGTGLARSGGALYSMCLSTHPEMMVACCPNLELFRSFRNTVLRRTEDASLTAAIPSSAPLQDYYGTSERIRALDAVMGATLDVPFQREEWDDFLTISVARGDLESRDLTSHYSKLQGQDYRSIFSNLLTIIADARQSQDRQWVGFHEAWALDAYPALARAYPDAHFLVMFRDPRAVVSSMYGVERIDPSQVAQTLSYVRHWRKYAALALRFSKDPLFAGRLHLTAHDLVLTRTRTAVEGICNSLGLPLDERMLDTDNYIDFSTGQVWGGNSSFEGKTSGIKAYRALRWREQLDPVILKSIEYLCGPDLKLMGYQTLTPFADPGAIGDYEIFDFLTRENSRHANWRSDLQDPVLDIGLENLRRTLLTLEKPCLDDDLVRRCFLFNDTYHSLRRPKTPQLQGLPTFGE